MIWEERWGTPTVHISCDFSSPSFFGEELDFEIAVKKVGRSSVTLHHEISCKGQKRWSSVQILAASDLDKHCSIPWPEDVRQALLSTLLQKNYQRRNNVDDRRCARATRHASLLVKQGLRSHPIKRIGTFHHELHWNQGDPSGGLLVMLKGKRR